MPDEVYASLSREHYVDPNGASPVNSFPNTPHTPSTTDHTSSTNPTSSPPRSSSESVGRTSSKWRESLSQATLERRDTITTITSNPDTPSVVEPNFDENVLRMLCGLDVSGSLCGRVGVRISRPPLDHSVPFRCYWTGSNRALSPAR